MLKSQLRSLPLDRSFSYGGIVITAHAISRAKQRTHLQDSIQIASTALRSLEDGIDVWADPTLREMVESRVKKHNCSGIYALDGVVFFFAENAVTTVLPISWLALFGQDTAARAFA